MNTLEVLVAARALIAEPEHWCQKVGSRFGGTDMQHCLTHAIRWVAERPIIALVELKKYTDEPLENFNDTHSHAEVIGLLDTAIAELS